jgi:hypothetical protein
LNQTNKGKWIIDAESSAIVATTKVHPSEPEELEEGELLFHSDMWVKGAPLHFIVNSGSQKNLISVRGHQAIEPVDDTTPHIPTPSGGSSKEEISASNNSVIFPMASSPSRMRYCVIFLPLNF